MHILKHKFLLSIYAIIICIKQMFLWELHLISHYFTYNEWVMITSFRVADVFKKEKNCIRIRFFERLGLDMQIRIFLTVGSGSAINQASDPVSGWDRPNQDSNPASYLMDFICPIFVKIGHDIMDFIERKKVLHYI